MTEHTPVLSLDQQEATDSLEGNVVVPSGFIAETVLDSEVGPPRLPKALTLSQSRQGRVLEVLRAAGGRWITGPELGAAIDESGLSRQTRREALFTTLRSLESGGVALERTGTSRYRRYRLAGSVVTPVDNKVVAEPSGVGSGPEEPTAERQPFRKLTRWGLEWRDAGFFMGGCQLELDDLAKRCLGLLVVNPHGISRRRLRATLHKYETNRQTGRMVTEYDVRLTLGSVREQIGETEKRPRIEERYISNGRNRVELLTLVGVIARR